MELDIQTNKVRGTPVEIKSFLNAMETKAKPSKERSFVFPERITEVLHQRNNKTFSFKPTLKKKFNAHKWWTKDEHEEFKKDIREDKMSIGELAKKFGRSSTAIRVRKFAVEAEIRKSKPTIEHVPEARIDQSDATGWVGQPCYVPSTQEE